MSVVWLVVLLTEISLPAEMLASACLVGAPLRSNAFLLSEAEASPGRLSCFKATEIMCPLQSASFSLLHLAPFLYMDRC